MSEEKNRRSTGTFYEEKAAEYLKGLGMDIVCRNFRCRFGEIDLVAKDGDVLVFVEVKYRKKASAGGALCQVGYRKQRTISRVALFYLTRYGLYDRTACRFDVVGITGEELVHIKDAFEFHR
jgi:putative endonuclease